jgi:hypothetical protein
MTKPVAAFNVSAGASGTSITNSKASHRAEIEERLAGQSASVRAAS